MIRIKFEVGEEVETPLPIESKNVGFPSEDNLVVTNKLPEKNVVVAAKVPKKVVSKKKAKLDNSTMDSVDVCSKSIKTEPAESSLSLTTQLNNSLNIQSLLKQHRIQNGWTTNEQSIPNGTQQQQQSFLSTKIEPIVSDNQEVPLSLDLGSLNTNSEETTNLDATKVSLLDQSFSVSNPNSGETTATNCDITTTEMFPGPRAGLGRRAKLKVCYSVPKEPEPVPRRRKKLPKPSLPYPPSADNSESTNNDIDHNSSSGSISGFDSSTAEVAAPLAAVPENKPLRRVPPLTLEERKARQSEASRLWYNRQKTIPEVMAKIRRQKLEYDRKRKQQWLANATPEQLELRRLKDRERFRRYLVNETEEQRKRRLERVRHYARTVGNPRRDYKRQYLKPEETGGGGGGGGEESNEQTTTTLQSPKPGPSKLPRPTMSQRNVKSKIYLEPDTDSDDD